jgi:hypothetical protein
MKQSNTIIFKLDDLLDAAAKIGIKAGQIFKLIHALEEEIPSQQNQEGEVNQQLVYNMIVDQDVTLGTAFYLASQIYSQFIQPLQSELQKARGINENLIAANKLQTKELLQAASELQRLKEESFFNKFQEQLSNVQELMWENAKQKEEIDRLKKEVEENNQVIDHLTQQVIGKL